MRYARFFANVSPGLALWVCQVMTYVIGAAFLSRDLVGWLSTWVEEAARLGAQYKVGVPQQDGQKDGNLFDGYYSSNSAAAAVVTRFDCNLVSFNFRCGERHFLRGWWKYWTDMCDTFPLWEESFFGLVVRLKWGERCHLWETLPFKILRQGTRSIMKFVREYLAVLIFFLVKHPRYLNYSFYLRNNIITN